MSGHRLAVVLSFAALIAACGTTPPIEVTPDDDEPMVESRSPAATPMVESPPVEPVEPPEPPSPPVATPEPRTRSIAPPSASPGPAETPPPSVVPPQVVVPEVPSEDQQAMALVGDLARYAALPNEEIRKEIIGATQVLARQRSDANRVRLAMLYTLTRAPQDDQRALQLLENVARGNPSAPAMKQLAGIIASQVVERVRAVREEQQKADAAIQKLEALRLMERSLLRDRVRGGGGGGGGAGSGSGGSAGGR